MANKSIPCLELCSLVLGVKTLFDIREQLSGPMLLIPINIAEMHLYSDSMVVLNWLDGVTNKLSKLQNKLSVFVRNRLFEVQNLCSSMPVTFMFIAGASNPADVVSRTISPTLLARSCYYEGPKFLRESVTIPNILKVIVPCPVFRIEHIAQLHVGMDLKLNEVVPTKNYSSIRYKVCLSA